MPSFLLTEGEPLRVPRGRTEIRAMPEGQDSLRLDALGDADVDTLTTNTWLVRPGEDASTLTLTLPEVGAPGGRMPVTLHIRGRNGADDTTVDLPPIDVAGLTAVPILEISPVHGDPSRVAVRLLAPVRGPSMPVSAQAEQARTVARTVIGDDARGFGSDVTDHDGQRIVVNGSASMAGHLRSGLVARIVDTIDGVSLVRRGSRRSTLLLGLPDRLVTVVGSGDVTAQGFGGALAEEVATRPLTTGFRWERDVARIADEGSRRHRLPTSDRGRRRRRGARSAPHGPRDPDGSRWLTVDVSHGVGSGLAGRRRER